MIKVVFKKKEDKIVGFNISGHAEYDESGKDIVCAAVSMLVYNTIDTMTDLLKLKDYIEYKIDNDLITFKLIKELDEEQEKSFNLIMKKLELGVISTVESYNKYIELYYVEV